MIQRTTAVAILLSLTTGCVVGPKYKRPTVAPPNQYYTETAPQSNSVADLAWWELFKDPVLQELIREALKSNYDVAIAAARVEESRANAGVAHSVYFPQIGADITGQRAPIAPSGTYYISNDVGDVKGTWNSFL